MRADTNRARHPHGEFHRSVILVVSSIAETLDAIILAARVVIPDRADCDVATRLHDLVVNIVRLAAILSSFLGHEMDHVVIAGEKIDRAVDVEHIHPTSRLDASIPAPYVGVAAVLLLCAD